MAAAHIGYVVAFYVWRASMARGAAGAEFRYSVNTAFPWISGAAIAAGIDERRVYLPTFCDSLFQKDYRFALDRGDCSSISLELSA